MLSIYISYRRADSRPEAKHIYSYLANHLGAENVLKDIDLTISPELDARGAIAETVALCNATIVIIGPDWLTVRAERGNYLLKNPNDLVRIEIETGLTKVDIQVLPVLIASAQMPNVVQLPVSLQNLASINPVVLRDNPYFEYDCAQILNALTQKHI